MKPRTLMASVIMLAGLGLSAGALTLVPWQGLADPAGGAGSHGDPGAEPGLSGEAISVERVATDGDRALLRIRNRTPFMITLYISGVRVGWLRPYRVGKIRGLATGYHRLYAQSRYGTTSWGPEDVWVPGTWNVLY